MKVDAVVVCQSVATGPFDGSVHALGIFINPIRVPGFPYQVPVTVLARVHLDPQTGPGKVGIQIWTPKGQSSVIDLGFDGNSSDAVTVIPAFGASVLVLDVPGTYEFRFLADGAAPDDAVSWTVEVVQIEAPG
jgi:hypothetical protein